jgi:hypothetical protein
MTETRNSKAAGVENDTGQQPGSDLGGLLGGLLQSGDLGSLVGGLLGQFGPVQGKTAEAEQTEEGEAMLGGLLKRGSQEQGGLSPQLLQALQADPVTRTQAAGILPTLTKLIEGLGLPPILAEKLLPQLLEQVLGKQAAATTRKTRRASASRAKSTGSAAKEKSGQAPRKKSTAKSETGGASRKKPSSARSTTKPATKPKTGAAKKSGTSSSGKSKTQRKSADGLDLDNLLDQLGDALGQDKK